MDDRPILRVLLRRLADLRGIPQDLGELAAYAAGRVRGLSELQVTMHLETLATLGYVEPFRPSADLPVQYRLTASGLRQIERKVRPQDLDLAIWESNTP